MKKYLALVGIAMVFAAAGLMADAQAQGIRTPAAPPPVTAAPPPPANIYSVEPFVSGKYFSSARCASQRIPCDGAMSRAQQLTSANICAAETYGMKNLLGDSAPYDGGPYSGCVIPTNFKNTPDAPLKKTWVICCPMQKGNYCTYNCHLYYNNEEK